ncbi:hypothetical protein BGX28_002497 [Mortierella sp. GBA30]|nr:hypothetical protein BGX28_002497 [Mortierella sp. GBA30]
MASLGSAILKQRHLRATAKDVDSIREAIPLQDVDPQFTYDQLDHAIHNHVNNTPKKLRSYRSDDGGIVILRSGPYKFSRTMITTITKPRLATVLYLGFLLSLVLLAHYVHYSLPRPLSSEEGSVLDPSTGQRHLRFSEENVRKIVRHLSEDIGYRVVGTAQDQETQAYLIREIKALKDQAQRERVTTAIPQFETWIQIADGSHKFDFMSKVVMKMYTNMTNIVVRLSCGPECDKNAILLNAHYDTTLGSPGAADDALPVGVMLELIRILSQQPAPKKNSLIFCNMLILRCVFNGGEESLQDASHSFITNHELRHSIKAVINLEACGTTGPEVLFQANSRTMIDAYRQVPYPHGTAMGNDLFTTGFILSDTDFRQFVEYGNLTGLDMAVYKNSYLYHTHLDLDRHMERGLPQHLGENTLALTNYLANEAELVGMQATSAVVYFDVFGKFFVSYSMDTAIRSHALIGMLALMSMAVGVSRPTVRSMVSVFLSFIAALLAPSLSAFVVRIIGTPMVWFSHEWLPLAIYGPMSLAGMFAIQWIFHQTKASPGANELSAMSGIQIVYTISMIIASVARIASSYFLAMYSLVTSAALIYNSWNVLWPKKAEIEIRSVKYSTYFVASAIQTLYSSYGIFSLYDMLVPLTGRIGVDAPVDLVVAVVTGFGVFMFCPPLLAFSHRFGRVVLKRLVIGLVLLHLFVVLISSSLMYPYNELHPKRVFAQHLRNITSGESLMFLAHCDPGPFQDYVAEVEKLFDTKAEFRNTSFSPNDWKSVYPFSQFLESFVIDTAPYIRKHTTNRTIADSERPLTALITDAPRLVAENVSYDPVQKIRRLTILCTHPNYIWTVTSFDAEVLDWSMGLEVPSKQKFHYVIRHAGGFRTDGWKLELAYRASGRDDRLRIELTAMETEGFGKDMERELVGSGEIGVMRRLVKAKPDYVALTYFSSVLSNFEL